LTGKEIPCITYVNEKKETSNAKMFKAAIYIVMRSDLCHNSSVTADNTMAIHKLTSILNYRAMVLTKVPNCKLMEHIV
jgi:hypothetical protein